MKTAIEKSISGLALALALNIAAASDPNASAASALSVKRLDHVGINVPDADQAISFFSALMGAKVVSDVRPAQPDRAWKRQYRWHRDSRLERLVMLQTASDLRIEIFQYSGGKRSRLQPYQDDIGETHIALEVEDLDASLKLVRDRGLQVLSEPSASPEGARWTYILTPWRSQIELLSYKRSPAVSFSYPAGAPGAGSLSAADLGSLKVNSAP